MSDEPRRKISELTAEAASPETGDVLAIVNGGVTKKIQAANLLKVIAGLSEETTPASTDLLAIITGGAPKKMQLGSLVSDFFLPLLLAADAAAAREILNTYSKSEVYSQAEVDARVFPIGSYLFRPTGTPPDGYLECDGSAISRTTYAALFADIGTMYGVGDGSTTFNIPDFRGLFPRAWAHGQSTDPDRASRTDRGDGTTGDYVGTKQADELESHKHNYDRYYEPSPSGTLNYGIRVTYQAAACSESSDTIIKTSGGNESRPVNRYVMVCIKY